MNSFVEDYLSDCTQAIVSAAAEASGRKWYDEIDEELVYSQIASPEFRLYEEMILCDVA